MKCVKISYKLTELKVKVLKFITYVFFIYNSFREKFLYILSKSGIFTHYANLAFYANKSFLYL